MRSIDARSPFRDPENPRWRPSLSVCLFKSFFLFQNTSKWERSIPFENPSHTPLFSCSGINAPFSFSKSCGWKWREFSFRMEWIFWREETIRLGVFGDEGWMMVRFWCQDNRRVTGAGRFLNFSQMRRNNGRCSEEK